MDSVSEPLAPKLRSARRFMVVANRTGGQGKTLVAHLMAVGLRRRDPDFRVMCADSVETPGEGAIGRSKLGGSVSGVIEVGSGPSMAQIQLDPSVAYAFWDTIGAPLLDTSGVGLLLDVGANVIDRIFDWAAAADLAAVFGDSVRTDLVVPVVATGKSVADAREMVAVATGAGGLPLGAVYVVENGWQGSFAKVADNRDYTELVRMASASGGGVIALPHCVSELLSACELSHVYLGDAEAWDHVKVAERFSWPLIKASRELRSFKEWMGKALAGFGGAGLLDPELYAAHGSGRSASVRDRRPA